MTETSGESRIPATSDISLDAERTAVLVLDLTAHGEPPPDRRAYLVSLAAFLDRARAAGAGVCFTGIAIRPDEPVEPLLGHREADEPLWYPAAYDKFYGGEIEKFLDGRGTDSIVITGSATNVAVMYTATAAARHYRYIPYVPVDGAFVSDPYRHEYALFQLSVLPSAPNPVRFTTLDGIGFH